MSAQTPESPIGHPLRLLFGSALTVAFAVFFVLSVRDDRMLAASGHAAAALIVGAWTFFRAGTGAMRCDNCGDPGRYVLPGGDVLCEGCEMRERRVGRDAA